MNNPFEPLVSNPIKSLGTKRVRRFGVFLLLFVVYVSSYYALSRRAFAQADAYGMNGFYFLTPRDSVIWLVGNYTLVCIYYPAIKIDNLMGTGRAVAAVPMMGLS